MSKIYVRLAGGLGNQLFQLAASLLLAKRLGRKVVPLTRGLARYAAIRQPDSLKLLEASPLLLPSTQASSRVLDVFAETLRVGRWAPYLGVSDRTFWRVAIRRSAVGPLVLDGYFQHGWGTGDFLEAISAFAIAAPKPESAEVIKSGEGVLHIRGGDFLKLPRFQVANKAYYCKSLSLAEAAGLTQFAIMSDDRSYATQLMNDLAACLPQIRFRLLPPSPNSLADFEILRRAGARVIGNSTFAWWATALGDTTATTWAPTKIAVDEPRDFFLPWEIPVAEA